MLNEFGTALLDHLDERGWSVEDLVDELEVLLADHETGIDVNVGTILDMMICPWGSRPDPYAVFWAALECVLGLDDEEAVALLGAFMPPEAW